MTAATTHTATIARTYLDARDSLDVDTLAACRHPDFAIHWPQRGEGSPTTTPTWASAPAITTAVRTTVAEATSGS